MIKAKILLIHGWNYVNYTSSGCVDAWANRSKFVQTLSQHFNVVTINLPGFCGQSDPERPWALNDYVNFVGKIIEKEKPDYILGYSFGGAIALRWKKQNERSGVKIVLVSPAILRKYEYSNLNFLQKTLKMILPDKFVSLFRDFYLTYIIKNPYYSKATKVMRETYRNIVAVDLRDDLHSISEPLTLIYGENDSATPPVLIKETLKDASAQHNLYIISGGGHDIANTHTDELVNLIKLLKGVAGEA
jgi:pimeloyl-ACP methyl ester carboxylesterase